MCGIGTVILHFFVLDHLNLFYQLQNCLIFILSPAFDCINHAVLLEKMKFYGVSGKFYILVKSYLDGRYQKVILSYNNGIESTWEKIKQGVPQGSILGPIFF